MEISVLEKNIQQKKLEKQIFLFSGKEDFLKEQTTNSLIKALVQPEDEAENVFRIDFEFSRIEEFFGNLSSFSFNSSPRIFLLYRLENLVATQRKIFFEKLSDTIPVENILVIFLTQSAPISGEIISALKEKCERIDFWPPFENQLPRWIQKNAQDRGFRVSFEGAQVLIKLVGSDLRLLSQELSKLSLLAKADEEISNSVIKETVGYQREDTIFDLIDSIGQRNLSSTLRIFESLLKRGEPLQKIWFMVCNTLREYKLLHDLSVDRPDLLKPLFDALHGISKLHRKTDFQANQERKQLSGLIQKQVASWPILFSEALRLEQTMQLRNLSLALKYSRSELLKIWPQLVEIDHTLKSSTSNPTAIIQNFLVVLVKGLDSFPTLEGKLKSSSLL